MDGDEETCLSRQNLDILSTQNNKYNIIRVFREVNTTAYISYTAVFNSAVLCIDHAVFLFKRDLNAIGQACDRFLSSQVADMGDITTKCKYTIYCNSRSPFCDIYIFPSRSRQLFALCEMIF